VDADLFGLGWRTIFWVNLPVAAAALLLGRTVLPESTAEHRARLDLTGAALATVAVFLVLLPLVQGRGWGWPWWGWALLAAGAALFAAFLAHERRVVAAGGRPILDPALLRIRTFAAGLLVSILFFGAIGSFFLILSVYLQVGTGRSAWDTGLVILPYAVGSILTSGLGIALAARAGRLLLVSGSLLLAASQALLWVVVRGGAEPGYGMLALALLVGGLGIGLTAPILINVVLAGVPGRDAGAAGGVLTTVTQIGGAAGVAILGTLFFSRVAAAPADGPALLRYGDAFSAVLAGQVGCYVVAAALMLLLPQTTAAPGER
jgi:Na+/melibiose symporter-like transporter